jgi:hypothetical protein
MMGATPTPSPSGEMSVLRALARLLDPEAGPEIERLAETLPREDVRQAVLGLRELLDLVVSLTPIEQSVQVAIADLQQREAALAAREARLLKRETAISQALSGLEEL